MAVNVGKISAILELKNRMSAQLRAATKDMDRFQSKMDKLGQDATRLGGAMTAGITAPLTVIAATSVRTFAEFEHTMASVKAVTGATGEEFGNLGKLAEKMGATTVFTASQSAEAMRAFGLAGFSTNEIMSALGPTLNLAAAGSMEMGVAADIAAKVTRGYGIAAEDTTHAMDVLTKAFTTSNTNLVELGNAFKMVGPVAKTAGLGFEQTTAALQIMADAGIVGSMGGRQLRRALLGLVNPSGEAAKQLKTLGVETQTAGGRLLPFDQIMADLEPHLQNTAAMATIFGTIAMPGMVAILEKGTGSLNEMTQALVESDGTGQRIADVMLNNLTGAWTLFMSAVEGVQNAIGKELEPVLRQLIATFTKLMQFVSGTVIPAFSKLPDSVKFATIALLAAAAASGVLILSFGLLAPVIPVLIRSTLGLVGAFTGIGNAVPVLALRLKLLSLQTMGFAGAARAAWLAITGPVGLAIGIGVAVVALVAYVQKAKGARRSTDEMREAIVKARDSAFAFEERWVKLTKKQRETPAVLEAVKKELEALGDASGAVSPVIKKEIDAAAEAMRLLELQVQGLTDTYVDGVKPLGSYSGQLSEAAGAAAAAELELQRMNDTSAELARLGLADWLDETSTSIDKQAGSTESLDAALAAQAETLGTLDTALGGTVDSTNDAIDANREWEKIAEQWRQGTIPQALNMVRALEEVGGLAALTRAEQDALNDTLHTAMLKYDALGKAVPKDIVDAWLATLQHPEFSKPGGLFGEALEPPRLSEIPGWFELGGQFYQELDAGLRVGMPGGAIFGTALQPPPGPDPKWYTFGAILGDNLKTGFISIVAGLPDTIISAFTGGGGLFGAMKAIGTQAGSTIGGSLGDAWGATLAAGEGAGKIMKGIAGMAGPMGAAIGALAGPLIGFIGKLFSGPSVQERVTEAAAGWGVALSEGLADAIAETRETVSSDIGAMMVHLADIMREGGGVAGMGFHVAAGKVRDLFVMLETGRMTVEQVGSSFDETFRMLADAAVESGEIVGREFTELFELADRFGVRSGEVMAFMAEQTGIAATGLAALFGPTIAEADALNTKIEETNARLGGFAGEIEKAKEQINGLEKGTDDYAAAEANLNQLLSKHSDELFILNELLTQHGDLASKSKGELADLGIIAVASFESALASGMSFTEAVRATAPALDAVIAAQSALGITSENVAIQALTQFQNRVRENETLVTGVEALDDTMLALSRTGSLNADTLAAMERQGLRMFEKLTDAGFTEQEALLMMADSVQLIMEAHEKLGIPIDENTQALIDQMTEAGALETKQVTGWSAVEAAILLVVGKLDEMIGRIFGVNSALEDIPRDIDVDIALNANRTGPGWDDLPGGGGDGGGDGGGGLIGAQHGLVGDFGSGTPVMLHGKEAVVPLGGSGGGDLSKEIRALREQIELLPLHLRDAILLSQ